MKRRQFLPLLSMAAATPLAFAQGLSGERVVRIISGFAAGSPIDAAARMFAPALEKQMNARVIVDYKIGAGGRIGNTYVKNAKPDATTLLIASSSLMAIYPHVFKKLAYDPVRDFIPVTSVVDWEYGIAISNMVPESVRTLADYVEWLRKSPEEGNYGIPAAGSIPHFLGTSLSQMTRLRLTPVPFPGSAPHMQALNGGQVPMGIDTLSGIIPHLGSGRIRLLATSGNERTVPGVPTVAEAGFKELSAVDYYGFFFPAGTAPEAVQQVTAAVQQALLQPAIQEVCRQMRWKGGGQSPASFARRLQVDLERWRSIVLASGFTVDE